MYTRPIQIKCFWDLIWLYSNLSTKAAKECCNSNWWSWLIIIQLTMLEIDAYASMNIFNKFWRLLNNKQFVDSGERCNRDEFLKNKIKMILEKMFILLETKNIFLRIIYKQCLLNYSVCDLEISDSCQFSKISMQVGKLNKCSKKFQSPGNVLPANA